MTKSTGVSGLAVLGLCIGLPGTVHAQLVTNGSFESTTGLGMPDYNITLTDWNNSNGVNPNPIQGYTLLFNPSVMDTTGVVGNSGPVILCGPNNGNNNGLTASLDGGNFIAADSDYQVGALTQTINGLTVGQTYDLSFYYAAAQQQRFSGATSDQWIVSLGSQTYTTPTLSIASHGFSGWQQQTFSYTATAGSELLSFLASSPSGGAPPFVLLDGVSMVEGAQSGVPEPTAVASLFAGIIGTGIFIRRRTRTVKSAS